MSAGRARASDYEELICSYPWPCQTALAVMRCESSGDPLAYSVGNYGLFQINATHAWMAGGDPSALFDPVTNVAVAYRIWEAQGWSPWGCRGA